MPYGYNKIRHEWSKVKVIQTNCICLHNFSVVGEDDQARKVDTSANDTTLH